MIAASEGAPSSGRSKLGLGLELDGFPGCGGRAGSDGLWGGT